jgi:hypothetical protein
MHVYIAGVMELHNEINEFCKQAEHDLSDIELVLTHIFIPVLWVIAPCTVRKLKS